MEKRFYIDTSIWRDYFEDRTDGIRPLGMFAFRFLNKCLREGQTIIVSEVVEGELLRYFSKERVEEVFLHFGKVIEKISRTKEQDAEAHLLFNNYQRRFPLADILHAVMARDEESLLVSRDKHFVELGLAEVAMPEDLC